MFQVAFRVYWAAPEASLAAGVAEVSAGFFSQAAVSLARVSVTRSSTEQELLNMPPMPPRERRESSVVAVCWPFS